MSVGSRDRKASLVKRPQGNKGLIRGSFLPIPRIRKGGEGKGERAGRERMGFKSHLVSWGCSSIVLAYHAQNPGFDP